jgi:hypothetical protein
LDNPEMFAELETQETGRSKAKPKTKNENSHDN